MRSLLCQSALIPCALLPSRFHPVRIGCVALWEQTVLNLCGSHGKGYSSLRLPVDRAPAGGPCSMFAFLRDSAAAASSIWNVVDQGGRGKGAWKLAVSPLLTSP